MANYTKLFNSIVTSTIWTEDDQTRLVWITLLALADKHGEVHASIPGLARVAGITLEKTELAINKFLSPDPYSRTLDDEGRRIEQIDGGWFLLNHAKYRMLASKEEQKTSNAIRQQRFRVKKARNATGHNDDTCVYCGKKANGVDHVVPQCKGGGDEAENLVRCCKVCNGHKASRNLIDFLNDLTLPFAIDSKSVLASSVLSKSVTLSNGIWSTVTQQRDIAEADTDTDIVLPKGKNNKRFDPTTIKLPFESDDFAHFWESWTLHRKEIKKPLTERTAKMQLENLKEMGETRAIAAIRNSIGRGYTGLFEDTTSKSSVNAYATRHNDKEQIEIPDL